MSSPGSSQKVAVCYDTHGAVLAALAEAERTHSTETLHTLLRRAPVFSSSVPSAPAPTPELLSALTAVCDTNTSTMATSSSSSSSSGVPKKLTFVNAAWKLLHAALSHPRVPAGVFRAGLAFMLQQLRHAALSHDWADAKAARLAAFVASHVASAARAHPELLLMATAAAVGEPLSAATKGENDQEGEEEVCGAEALLEGVRELGGAVAMAVATSEGSDAAALSLFETLAPRLGSVWGAVGAAAVTSAASAGHDKHSGGGGNNTEAEEEEEEAAAASAVQDSEAASSSLTCVMARCLPRRASASAGETKATALERSAEAVQALSCFLSVVEGAVSALLEAQRDGADGGNNNNNNNSSSMRQQRRRSLAAVPLVQARVARDVFCLLLRWLPGEAAAAAACLDGTDLDTAAGSTYGTPCGETLGSSIAHCAADIPPELFALSPDTAAATLAPPNTGPGSRLSGDSGDNSAAAAAAPGASPHLPLSERWALCARDTLRLALAASASASASASAAAAWGSCDCLLALSARLAAPDEAGGPTLLWAAAAALSAAAARQEGGSGGGGTGSSTSDKWDTAVDFPPLHLLVCLGAGAVRSLQDASSSSSSSSCVSPPPRSDAPLLLRWAASLAALTAAVCVARGVQPRDLLPPPQPSLLAADGASSPSPSSASVPPAARTDAGAAAEAFASAVAACVSEMGHAAAGAEDTEAPAAAASAGESWNRLLDALRAVEAAHKRDRRRRGGGGGAVDKSEEEEAEVPPLLLPLVSLPLLLRRYRECVAAGAASPEAAAAELSASLCRLATPLSGATLLLQSWARRGQEDGARRAVAVLVASSLLREVALFPLASSPAARRGAEVAAACVRKWCAMSEAANTSEGENEEEEAAQEGEEAVDGGPRGRRQQAAGTGAAGEVELYAAQCLLYFVQHNTDLSVADLRLPPAVAARLADLLRGGAATPVAAGEAASGEQQRGRGLGLLTRTAAAAALQTVARRETTPGTAATLSSSAAPPLPVPAPARELEELLRQCRPSPSVSPSPESPSSFSSARSSSSSSSSPPRGSPGDTFGLDQCESIVSALLESLSGGARPRPGQEEAAAAAARLTRVMELGQRALQVLLTDEQKES